MDWALVKVKGDLQSSLTGVAGMNGACAVFYSADQVESPGGGIIFPTHME